MYFLKNLIVDKISFITKWLPAVKAAETKNAIFKSQKKRGTPVKSKALLQILKEKK